MECTFFKCSCDKNVLDKTNYLTLLESREITLLKETEIISPVIILKSEIVFDYVYLEKFNKYYFLENCVFYNNLFYYSLNIDVLFTYLTQIKNHVSGVVFESKNLIDDKSASYNESNEVKIKQINYNNLFNGNSKIMGVVYGI